MQKFRHILSMAIGEGRGNFCNKSRSHPRAGFAMAFHAVSAALHGPRAPAIHPLQGLVASVGTYQGAVKAVPEVHYASLVQGGMGNGK
jgi:hypothetical protein